MPAADWTVSGIVGAGNRVNLTGVEVQAASDFGGTLADRWSWSLLWSGDVAYWWARNHDDSALLLWETGLTPVVELCHALASEPSAGVTFGELRISYRWD